MQTGPGRITLWAIEIFVATADEGSISAAARRLGASPSTVSQQLTNLETAVGATLLERNSRPVLLTPAGEIFCRRARAIISEAELARAELTQGDLSALTRFRLGVIEDLEADVTPSLLARMSDQLNDCQFLLETGASHTLISQLEDRELDVIVAADTGERADGYEVHSLVTEYFVGAAPKGLLDHSADLAGQLMSLPLVQYTRRHHMGRLIDQHLAQNNLHLRHRFELDSYHAILALVAKGGSWTILTPLALQRAQRFAPDLDVFALPFGTLSRTISLTARTGILGQMPRDVADHLKSLLQEIIVDPVITSHPWMKDTIRVL